MLVFLSSNLDVHSGQSQEPVGISQAYVRLREGSSSSGPAMIVDTQNRVSAAGWKKLQRGSLWKIRAHKSACVCWGVLKATSKAGEGSCSERPRESVLPPASL